MKKAWMILMTALALCLLAAPSLAADIPDPDFFFNAGADKQTSGDTVTRDYVLPDDPRQAVEAYVSLLTGAYGFTLTDSYLEPEIATWRLESDSAEQVRIDYDQGGQGYLVSIRTDADIACRAAEAWDWSKQAVAGAESNDITVLPDFLKHDSSGKYDYRGTGFSFRADSTSSACVNAVKAYVDLLLQRGYTLVSSEEEHKSGWDLYKWYLHSGLSGLGKIKSDVNAHVEVKLNVYTDNRYSALAFGLVPGLTMSDYGKTPADDDNDLFEKDCYWCGYDGRCDTCGGTGRVRKNVAGTREYIEQNCEDCVGGSCDKCGGDGNMPN